MRVRARIGLGLSIAMLAGATVWAQRPPSALPKDAPTTPSNRRWTFEDMKSIVEVQMPQHSSLEVTQKIGGVDVRVRVESIEELERARPILERVIELGPVSFGWFNRVEELKAELTEALGKVPDDLTVDHELRMRDMERKLDRILKALEKPNREGGQ